ncbi:MAG: hypothetical protein ACXVLQ_09540 [Bacteriovorax sp.]
MDNQTTPNQATPAQVAPVQAAPAHAAEAVPTQTAPAPEMVNGVKVFPTSYIPAKAELHTPKKALVEMEHWHIEGIHIVIFFLVTFCLFIGMWKRPNLR